MPFSLREIDDSRVRLGPAPLPPLVALAYRAAATWRPVLRGGRIADLQVSRQPANPSGLVRPEGDPIHEIPAHQIS